MCVRGQHHVPTTLVDAKYFVYEFAWFLVTNNHGSVVIEAWIARSYVANSWWQQIDNEVSAMTSYKEAGSKLEWLGIGDVWHESVAYFQVRGIYMQVRFTWNLWHQNYSLSQDNFSQLVLYLGWQQQLLYMEPGTCLLLVTQKHRQTDYMLVTTLQVAKQETAVHEEASWPCSRKGEHKH